VFKELFLVAAGFTVKVFRRVGSRTALTDSYNLAGTGKAAPDSLKAAILMAAEMARRRFGAER